MGHGDVIRPAAVICDIYGTLLEFDPTPGDPAAEWRDLLREFLPDHPASHLPLARFESAVGALVEFELAAGRAAGAVHPEVDWPALAARVLPAIDRLDARARDAFFLGHARLAQRTRLMPGAADCLRWFAAQKIVLGIASNAQSPTLAELDSALASAGLSSDCFDPALCFYSFQHGFAKPDPRVFRWLSARLSDHGIPASSVLMVGDSVANDIAPAVAAGWGTWHLRPHAPVGPGQGPWAALRDALTASAPAPADPPPHRLANPPPHGTLPPDP